MNRESKSCHRTLPLALLALAACASTSETAGRDQLTAHVGLYPPPATGVPRVRIGVPAFTVADGVEAALSPLAADQLVSLASNTQRFDVIERTQLDQLLREQGLEGIVVAGELARPAQVRGVEWLLLGKVTSLRIKREHTGSSFNLGDVPVPGTFGTLGLFGMRKSDVVLEVECGVDLRLIDATTGTTIAADFSEYDRKDAAGALGLQILGGGADGDAGIEVSQDDQGRILRLALDDCVRKLLPKVDSALRARTVAPVPNAGASAVPVEAPAAAAVFCSQCGTRAGGDSKFCSGCGHALR